METNEQLLLSRRLIPGIVAGTLFMVFLSFMVGYFLGVKYTTDEFVTQIRQETLADQFLVGSVTRETSMTTGQGPQAAAVTAPSEVTSENPVVVIQDCSRENDTPRVAEETVAVVNKTSQVMRFGAELIGFGTKGAADEFIKRVAGYSPILLLLKEHKSKSPRGRNITWYQVVTNKYEQKEDLQKMLDILIKKEHLHDIKIVAYASSAKDLA